jgi:hypothetical protein
MPILWTAPGAPNARAVPAKQADTLDITLFAGKPTAAKLSQKPIGLMRVTAQMLSVKAGQVIDFRQPGAYALVYGTAGSKKMAATYFMLSTAANASAAFMEVQLVGPTNQPKATPFECLLPTTFDVARGVVFNVRVESTGGIKNCASTDKGFKVAFEYNIK